MSKARAKIGSSYCRTRRAVRNQSGPTAEDMSDTPENMRKRLLESRKIIGRNPIQRPKIPTEMNFNDALKVARASTGCHKALPTKKFKMYPTLMQRSELERLNVASKIVTLEERVAESEKKQMEAKMKEDESNKRKKILKDIDEARAKAKLEKEMTKGGKQLDERTEEKLKILDRAFIAKYEQTEEVKKANQIILEAKCHVIRDAQIHEKDELLKELRDEQIRLDKKMLVESAKSLKAEDEKFEEERIQKYKYAAEIKRQLDERDQLKALELARFEEEAKKLKMAYAIMKQEDELDRKLKHEKRDKLRKDLKEVYDMNQIFKKMIFDQEREADLQVQKYMQAKAEREKKFELEQKFAKELEERKKQFLYNNQKKIIEMKSDQGEETLRRDQDNLEREFRRKEKETALRRKQQIDDMKKSRIAQMNEIKQRQALQMARNEDDFNRTVQRLQSEEAQYKKREEERLKNRDKYREEIIHQMNEKEYARREMENRAKNEYNAWMEKEELRGKNIRKVIDSKLKALRETNLPEKYIENVERRLQSQLRTH